MPKPFPECGIKDPEEDAHADETNEGYDSFDILLGFTFSHSSISLPRKPGSLLIRGPYSRAQSVESTGSSVTADLFITSSQAASPGASTSYTELTESQETRLSHLLDTKPAASPVPQASADLVEPTLGSYVRPTDVRKREALPSFNAFLQSIGQLRSSFLPMQGDYDANRDSGDRDPGSIAARSVGPLSETSNIEDLAQGQLISTNPFSINSYSLLVEPPRLSTHPPISDTGDPTPVDSTNSRPCIHTTMQSSNISSTTPSRRNVTLSTDNGDELAHPGLMSIPSLLASPSRPQYHPTGAPHNLASIENDHQPKKCQTTQRRARQSTSRQKHANSPSQESMLGLAGQSVSTVGKLEFARTIDSSPKSSPLVPRVSLESEEELEIIPRSNKVPRLSRAHGYIRGASTLSASWIGSESPPTTPDHLLLDLGEGWESDYHDDVEKNSEK